MLVLLASSQRQILRMAERSLSAQVLIGENGRRAGWTWSRPDGTDGTAGEGDLVALFGRDTGGV
jgi:hypothetical protein